MGALQLAFKLLQSAAKIERLAEYFFLTIVSTHCYWLVTVHLIIQCTGDWINPTQNQFKGDAGNPIINT